MERICKNCKHSSLNEINSFCHLINQSVYNNVSCNVFQHHNSPDRKQILNQFLIELQKAEEKYSWDGYDLTRKVLALGEEAGEVLRACNHIIEGKGTLEELKEEIYQTGAMCIRLA